MSIELITLLLFASMFILLLSGLPIAFALGAVSVIFCIAFWGFDHLSILATNAFSSLANVNLIAAPLFMLMGWILVQSGVAEDLFDAVHVWMGKLKGGLAIGTIVMAALFGALCGDLIAGLFTITTIALPPLLKRDYDKKLALGTVMSGGLVSFLVPPSIMVIVFASVTRQSVGALYMGCFLPGFLLAALYILYIAIRCHFNPKLGPAASDTGVTWGVRMAKLKGVIAPVVLFVGMLAAIYSGAATPVEASAIGVAGALVCGAVKKRLTWKGLWDSLKMTAQFTAMLGWMFMAVGAFTAVYVGMGASQLAYSIAESIPGGAIVVVIIMQLIIFVLGMFLDALAITLIFGPIFINIVTGLGFSELVFGILFMINIQAANMTPPYGFALFYMRTITPRIPGGYDAPIGDIWRAALPFVLIQLLCMALILIFPQIGTIVPDLLL